MPASVWGLGGVTELGESGLHGILVLRGQLSRDEDKGRRDAPGYNGQERVKGGPAGSCR